MMVAAEAKCEPNGNWGQKLVERIIRAGAADDIKSASGLGLACVDELMWDTGWFDWFDWPSYRFFRRPIVDDDANSRGLAGGNGRPNLAGGNDGDAKRRSSKWKAVRIQMRNQSMLGRHNGLPGSRIPPRLHGVLPGDRALDEQS